MNRTMAQRRAAHALARVKALENTRPPEWRSDYVSYVEQLPAAILMNGLGQALAFELAAAKEPDSPHHQLYLDVEDWLCGEYGPYYQPGGQKNLMKAIVEGDRNTYLRAQAEALAWLEWLKRFAVAYLKPPRGAST